MSEISAQCKFRVLVCFIVVQKKPNPNKKLLSPSPVQILNTIDSKVVIASLRHFVTLVHCTHCTSLTPLFKTDTKKVHLYRDSSKTLYML